MHVQEIYSFVFLASYLYCITSSLIHINSVFINHLHGRQGDRMDNLNAFVLLSSSLKTNKISVFIVLCSTGSRGRHCSSPHKVNTQATAPSFHLYSTTMWVAWNALSDLHACLDSLQGKPLQTHGMHHQICMHAWTHCMVNRYRHM